MRVPDDRDVATYMVMGDEMLHGQRMYTDVFEQNPPAPYLVFAAAERIVGYGRHSANALFIIASVLTLLGLTGFGWRVRGRWAPLLPVAWGALALTSLHLESIQAMSEIFMNACLVWVALLCLEPPALAGARLVEAAALTALASLFKHVGGVPGAALIAARLAWDAWARRNVRSGFRRLFSAGAVAGTIWGAFFAYFAAVGRWDDFFDTMTRYNIHYASLGFSAGIGKFLANLADGSPTVPAICIAWLVSIMLLIRLAPRERKRATLLLIFHLSAMVAVALPGQFSVHYYEFLIPPVAMTIGLCAEAMEGGWAPFHRVPAIVAAGLLAVVFAVDSLWAFRTPEPMYRELFSTQDSRIPRAIQRVLRPGEKFFVWGNEPWLYVDTRHRPAAGVFWADHARTSALADRLAARTVRQLDAERPEIIVVSRWRSAEKALSNPVGRYILDNYRPLPGGDLGDLYLMARKNGRFFGSSNG
ncbi:MAG: hypothetical protein JO102_04070 [Elusimicrobia bacterium]|nr:hypothetical protein [Elusimicrobiota bacterium]